MNRYIISKNNNNRDLTIKEYRSNRKKIKKE
jgi:hypothetical protein